MKSKNTVKDVEAIYIKRLRNVSGAKKMQTASDLFEAVKEIAKAGILYQNPGISGTELKKELMRRLKQ